MKHTRQEAAPAEPTIAGPRNIVSGTSKETYVPDWVPVRVGSQDHEKIPSLFGSRREYRDGRVEAA